MGTKKKKNTCNLEERLPFAGPRAEDGAAVVDEEGRLRDGAGVGRGADVVYRKCLAQPVVVQVLACGRGWGRGCGRGRNLGLCVCGGLL